MQNQRPHSFAHEYQFWFGIASLLFVIIGGIWHMSGRLSTIEQQILTQNVKVNTGFDHVSLAIDRLNADKAVFDGRVREIFRSCCSELRVSNEQ